MKVSHKHQLGFTLLELLVVISIIGILIAVGTAAFTTAQKKGRDARRVSDMKAIQSAYEQYFAENNTYATCGTMASALSGGSMPVDPKNVSPNVYTCNGSTAGYCACAKLEGTAGANSTASSSDVTCSFSTSSPTYFCVQNLQ